MASLEDKINALAAFKGMDPSEVSVDGDGSNYYDEFTIDGETYWVLTDDEADIALYDDVENFIDDVGITGFSKDFVEWIKSNALDQDWFQDACRESEEYYAQDIESESGDIGANRLIDECIEAGIISEDDLDEDGEYIGDLYLSEELGEYLYDQIDKDYSGDFVEWYTDNFGNRKLDDLVNQGGVSYDLQMIVDEIKDWDGYGNNLSKYDGIDNEENGIHFFRQD